MALRLHPAPEPERAETSFAPLAKGFRPFFVLAALLAVAFLPMWLFAFSGHLDMTAHFSGAMWHGHEMIFGFTIAVISGFLLTAVSHWTKRDTATGFALGVLCVLWLAGRVAVGLAAYLPAPVVAAVDLLFLPALAFAIGRPIIASENRRNFMFIGIITVFFLCNLVMHLGAMDVLAGYTRTALIVAMDVVILVTLIIGGRIIPNFTRNATNIDDIRSHRPLEIMSAGGMVAVILLTAIASGHWITGVISLVVGVSVALRMSHWGSIHTWDKPILWVLHAGHAWIAVGLMLRGASVFTDVVQVSAANHVLTVGAIGTLTLGMMSRVALGHTGRELHVSWPITLSFVLLTLGVFIRAFMPMMAPDIYMTSLVVSGTLWTLAFGIYLVGYTPILMRPRVDGRPG